MRHFGIGEYICTALANFLVTSPAGSLSFTQYTFFNFPLKNLWEQFHRPANVYFLGISILQTIKAISITNGTPTTLAPLVAVLVVSGRPWHFMPGQAG